jgi:uncharacterized protein (DUF302 family)
MNSISARALCLTVSNVHTKLLIFGNPRAGTPVMLAAPSSASDLPLKILILEDAKGKAWLSYNSPAFFQERRNLSRELLQNINAVENFCNQSCRIVANLAFYEQVVKGHSS